MLTLTPKPKLWKVLKKVKKNWSHELKHASTTTKTEIAKVRAEWKTIGTAEANHKCYCYTITSRWCRFSVRHNVLFEPHHHARWFHSI